MSHTASLSWFARHELNLAWRDWAALMSGGRNLQNSAIVIGMGVFALALHGLAYAVSKPFFASGGDLDTARLVLVSSGVLLTFTMMLSQAMESVTRAFYSRDDLDLILSSPASSRDLFAVRISIMAVTTAMMSGLMVAPFINVAVLLDGPKWFLAYGVVLAISGIATGLAVLITLGLFQSIGAKRTRLVAQIAAAIVGATFLIGMQVVGIVSYGTMSRWSVVNSQAVIDLAPAIDSLFWLPAWGGVRGFIVAAGHACCCGCVLCVRNAQGCGAVPADCCGGAWCGGRYGPADIETPCVCAAVNPWRGDAQGVATAWAGIPG